MGLQYVLSIFGRTLSDKPLSSAWRMTDIPEVVNCRQTITVTDPPEGVGFQATGQVFLVIL
jgi:hypothetical protein